MGLYPREENNTKNTTYKGVIMKTIFIINGMAGAGKDTKTSRSNRIKSSTKKQDKIRQIVYNNIRTYIRRKNYV